ncbi:hypothetical protein IID21_04270 [Patescibacteria group bacterium]|nr:hypothetical protein [Patescibacteria group bacterium]
MPARPEQEKSLDEELEALRAREKELSEKLEGGEDFGETFWELELIRSEIEERIAQIPSSGAQGMIGDGTTGASRGPEPERWRNKKED